MRRAQRLPGAASAATAPYLGQAEISAVMERAGLLIEEIEAMFRRDGEAKVLY
jgi:hypothetical protein